MRWMAALAAVMTMAAAGPAVAAEKIDFILNWIAGGDHAPYYYAQSQGWYAEAGLDVDISQGQGSTVSTQRVGAGASDLGLADLSTALVARGRGADVVAVMSVYVNSPYGLYWLKSSGIEGVEDMPGHSIGNPPGDAARAMWPALAQAAGIDPTSVRWVNVQPNAKLSALKSGAIDVTTSFYNIHHIFQRELGDDMGFLAWKDYGFNPYSNAFIANGDFLAEHGDAVKAFVQVSQRAFAACADDPDPCIRALVETNTGLQFETERANWDLVAELIADDDARSVAMGYLAPARMQSDYALVAEYFDITPFAIEDAYTNDMLDRAIRLP
ncbi:MAG: nitrate ABC transporter substrate-binding protein [Rhodospirillaceae bacterium]|nr:nitrate ABC transporter substrate-binding protein [Rhodospirillaceae bacterium]